MILSAMNSDTKKVEDGVLCGAEIVTLKPIYHEPNEFIKNRFGLQIVDII